MRFAARRTDDERVRRDLRSSPAGIVAEAIVHDALEVVFQPQVRLPDGALQGVEALVRWPRDLPGEHDANDVVDTAERLGLADALYGVVLRHALEAQLELAATGLDVEVAVNLSATSLHAGCVPATVEALAESGVRPERLVLELTESSPIVDVGSAVRVLGDLRGLGVRVALDDFGAGWSSMARLRRLPLDIVKLDRVFLEPLDSPVAACTITLARAAGLRALAEGVEDAAVLPALAGLGFDAAQGFAIGRPVRLDALLDDAAPRAAA